MEKKTKPDSLSTRTGLYLEASHGSIGNWFRDLMVSMAAWVPGLVGMAVRSIWDRLWIKGQGLFAMERRVRVLGAGYIRVDGGVYLDQDVYLHGRPGGLEIGAGTRVMRGAVLHVYNFRGLSGSGIRVGRDCVIGINSVITGQGGVEIEDDVIVAPGAMLLSVNHLYGDPSIPVRDQGIRAKGIRVGRGAWIGAGAIILDGVTVGSNAVVGAGAVVTRDVAAGAVVAGNPAQSVENSSGGGSR